MVTQLQHYFYDILRDILPTSEEQSIFDEQYICDSETSQSISVAKLTTIIQPV